MVDVSIEQNDGFAQQVATAAQTVFDYDYPIFDETHIEVLETPSGGVPVTLVLGTHYTVQDVGEEAGGTITLDGTAYPSGATAGTTYTMRLNVPEERTTDFQQSGDFFTRDLNQEFDLQTQMIQQLRRDMSKALTFRDDSTISDIKLPTPVDGSVLMWDGSSGQLVNAIVNQAVSTKRSLWIPARMMSPRQSSGASAFTVATVSGGGSFNPELHTMDFGSNEAADFQVVLPNNWNRGIITAQLYWSHASTTTNFGIQLGLKTARYTDGADMADDDMGGVTNSFVDTGGTTDALYISPESTGIIANPADTGGASDDGALVCFTLTRNGGNLGVDCRVHGVRLYYTIDSLDEF